MPFDTICFIESAAKNGYTAVTAAPDTLAGRTSGDNFETIKAGYVTLATQVSAAIANFVGGRFRHSRDPNYVELKQHFCRDQTGAVDIHNLAYISYPFKSGSILNYWADNGNNAQREAILLWLTYDGTPAPRPFPVSTPLNAKWVYGVGAATLVADTWTDVSVTWNETFEKDINYQIAGLACWSATGYVGRLKFAGSSPTATSYGGVPAGDTAILNQPLYGDFGQFRGDQPPNMQMIASAGDTAEHFAMLVIDPSLPSLLK